MHKRPARRVAALFLCVVLGLLSGAGPALADPPGDNGTIKIGETSFDTHPNNEPKVGCRFQIDFYGFDKGGLFATYTFDLRGSTPGGTLESGEVFIGEDEAAGGTDLDAEVTAELSQALENSGVEPKNGRWQVKLTVHADGSHGADTKFKVFKVQGPCGTGSDLDPQNSSSSAGDGDGGDATSDFETGAPKDGLSGGQLSAIAAAALLAFAAVQLEVRRRLGKPPAK
jgi:hypothetical protein